MHAVSPCQLGGVQVQAKKDAAPQPELGIPQLLWRRAIVGVLFLNIYRPDGTGVMNGVLHWFGASPVRWLTITQPLPAFNVATSFPLAGR